MKRFFSIILVLTLCVTATSFAFADGHTESYTIFMPEGQVTEVTEWGHYQQTTITYEDYGPGCTQPQTPTCPDPQPQVQPQPATPSCTPQKPCRKPGCTICCTPTCSVQKPCKKDGCPICHWPSAEELERRAREKAHADMKSFGKNTLNLLDRELDRIGWGRKTMQLVRSYETRLIYGASGDNKHPENLAPTVFYLKSDPSVCFKAYMVINPVQDKYFFRDNGYRDYTVMFVTDFNTGSGPYVYDEDWLITRKGQTATQAVSDFIDFLTCFYAGCGDCDDVPEIPYVDDGDCDCNSGCRCNK